MAKRLDYIMRDEKNPTAATIIPQEEKLKEAIALLLAENPPSVHLRDNEIKIKKDGKMTYKFVSSNYMSASMISQLTADTTTARKGKSKTRQGRGGGDAEEENKGPGTLAQQVNTQTKAWRYRADQPLHESMPVTWFTPIPPGRDPADDRAVLLSKCVTLQNVQQRLAYHVGEA